MVYSVSNKRDEKILNLLKDSSLSADTGIICVSVSKNLNTIKAFKELISHLSNSNDVLISSLGKTSMTIVLHEKFLEQIKSIFSKNILDIKIKVGAIFIKCSKEINSTPGVTCFISSLFADKNITIYEMIATYTDYVIIVKELEAYKMASYIQKILGE